MQKMTEDSSSSQPISYASLTFRS